MGGPSRSSAPWWARLRGLAAALLLLAVVARAATPAGWMPNPDAGAGGPAFVICGGGAASTDHDPVAPSHDRSNGHEVCAFAGVHAAPADPPPIVSEPIRIATVAEARRLAPPVIRTAPFRTPQAARAPPASV